MNRHCERKVIVDCTCVCVRVYLCSIETNIAGRCRQRKSL